MVKPDAPASVSPTAEAVSEAVATAVAVAPNAAPAAEEGCVYFGEYPQTIKAAGVTVGDTADERGCGFARPAEAALTMHAVSRSKATETVWTLTLQSAV